MPPDHASTEHARLAPAERAPGIQQRSSPATFTVKMLGARSGVVLSGTRDERIAWIAGRQRGRIARRQLLAAGVTSGAIRWLETRGHLFRVLRCVFAVGHTAPIPLGAETAALLAVGDDAALSHLSAASLWGLNAPDATIHVVVADRRGPALPGILVHRSSRLAGDQRIRYGLPVTSPARALLDIAPLVTDRELELAFDRGVVDRIIRTADIAAVLSRAGGHPGRARLRSLLQDDGPATMTRSEAEERMLALLRAADLPLPEVNARAHGYEIDFLWREAGFAVEVDGFRFHSPRTAFERDRRKDIDLRRAGIDVMRVTWRQLEAEPYAVVARIAEALARAGRRHQSG
jgi:very-short-patch-repair endonuclease